MKTYNGIVLVVQSGVSDIDKKNWITYIDMGTRMCGM